MPICRGTLCTNRVWKWQSQTGSLSYSDSWFRQPQWSMTRMKSEQKELVTNPVLEGAIGFYNICLQR